MASSTKTASTVSQTNPSPSFSFVSWTNLTNGRVIGDSQYATAALNSAGGLGPNQSYYYNWESFGFSIPSNATIQGIEATIVAKRTAGCTGFYGNVWLETSPLTGTPKGILLSGGNITTTDTTSVFGGSAYLWSTTWTPGEIGVIALRCSVNCDTGSGTFSLDGASLTVYYTLPRPGQPPKIFKQTRYAGDMRSGARVIRAQYLTTTGIDQNRTRTATRGPQFPRLVKAIGGTVQNFFKLNAVFTAPTKQIYLKSVGILTGGTTQVYFKKFVAGMTQIFYRTLGASTAYTSQSFRQVRKRVYGGR